MVDAHANDLHVELNLASEQLDIDGVLAFAEHVLANASRLWMELGLDQKQRLQQVLFPEGLRFDGEKFGTAVTCLAFKQLAQSGEEKSSLASPAGNTDMLHAELRSEMRRSRAA